MQFLQHPFLASNYGGYFYLRTFFFSPGWYSGSYPLLIKSSLEHPLHPHVWHPLVPISVLLWFSGTTQTQAFLLGSVCLHILQHYNSQQYYIFVSDFFMGFFFFSLFQFFIFIFWTRIRTWTGVRHSPLWLLAIGIRNWRFVDILWMMDRVFFERLFLLGLLIMLVLLIHSIYIIQRMMNIIILFIRMQN